MSENARSAPLVPSEAAPHNLLAAALWTGLSVLAFLALSVAVRELKGQVEVIEIMVYRSLIGLLTISAIAVATGNLARLRTRQLKIHALRSSVHYLGQCLWAVSVMLIPLAQVTAIEFTFPFWVILLGPLFLGERLTRMGLVATVFGFAGVLLVARPDFGKLEPGVLAAACAALFIAFNVVMTKRLTRGEPVISLVFWQAVVQLTLGVTAAQFLGGVSWPTWATGPWLLVVGLSGLLAHYCLTQALRVAPATVVAPMDFARLPFIALIGMLLYDEAIELAVFGGAALIFLGNWLNIRYGQR